ncbi:MAG: hypothetical protein V7632_3549 [Bradyrhizobium sp.]|jgi:hypothetical protein
MSSGTTGRGDTARAPSRDPWRVLVNVAQIPETGLHREIDADEATRKAMAELGELRDIVSAHAAFDIMPKRDGSYHVTGRVQARVGQTCVVTLDPIENDVDEEIDVTFAPPEHIPEMADVVDEAEDSDGETPDPPEPIEGGFIDIGRLATDALFLGVDPYPRRPDAVFEQTVEAPDPEDHPFAALKALQEKGGGKKPKGG